MAADPSVLAKIPQTYFDAWNGRDNHALDDFFAVSFTWTDPLLPEAITDLAGGQGFMSATWGGMSDSRFDLIGGPLVDEANSRVAQEWRFMGTLDGEFNGIQPTNKSCVVTGVDVYTLDVSGKVTAMSANYDSVSLLRQVGVA